MTATGPSLLAAMAFKGQWRDYQARVLDSMGSHLDDDRLHIVAAPGSGKTILGLEVVRRFGRPTIILAPTLTIRDQWCERLAPLFLDDVAPWFGAISKAFEQPAELTCITYQSLHAYWKDSNSDGRSERYLATIARLKEIGPVTLVVDECHHLRREWWSALFDFRRDLEGSLLVSLTATPPYDAPYAEWRRYESLCGEPDLEISVPELVRNGDLCPHQDHLHLSSPRRDEFELVLRRREAIARIGRELLESSIWIDWAESHPWMLAPHEREEEILENPQLLSALMIYLAAAARPLPRPPLEILGVSGDTVPEFTPPWLEILLDGMIHRAPEGHVPQDGAAKQLRRELHRSGLIRNERVRLQDDLNISRTMAGSIAKLDSIIEIAKAEAADLCEDLRMVVLSDFVRGDDLPKRANDPFFPPKLGVLPIFEALRRAGPSGAPLGVLTGSTTIIPEAAKDAAHSIAHAMGVERSLLSFGRIEPCPGYLRLQLSGASDRGKVALVTALFHDGHIRILAGTQALLGEGWDAPTINSLILASNAGSFVLSNQMRGRAIRIDPDRLGKVSNIWHLGTAYSSSDGWEEAMLASPFADSSRPRMGGEDLKLLERRFDSFEGISNYGEPLIENGLARLGIPLDAPIPEANQQTFEIARNREGIAERWAQSLGGARARGHVQQVGEASYSPRLVRWTDTIQYAVMSAFGGGAVAAGGVVQRVSQIAQFKTAGFLLMAFAGATLVYSMPKLVQTARLMLNTGSLERSLKQVARTIVDCLCYAGLFRNDASAYSIVVRPSVLGRYAIGVEGVNRPEERMFFEALAEILDPPENPRYILVRKSFWAGRERTDYHSVPAMLGTHRDLAEHFHAVWRKRVGPSELVYTRTHEGRLTLLRARALSFSARSRDPLQRRSMWL